MANFEKITQLNRSLIHIGGDDARTFLQGIITQDMPEVSSDDARFTSLLTPQGKILFDFFVVPFEDGFLLDCDANTSAGLFKRLRLYKLRAKIELSERDDLGLGVVEGNPPVKNAKATSFIDPRLADLGSRVIAPKTDFDTQNDQLIEIYHHRCISYGVANFGVDFGSEEVFPMDVNYDLLNGIDYKKGCFVGQEVASRMKRKGEVRRRTVIVNYNGGALETGADITKGDAKIASVLNGIPDIALILLRLDRWAKIDGLDDPILCNGTELALSFPSFVQSN